MPAFSPTVPESMADWFLAQSPGAALSPLTSFPELLEGGMTLQSFSNSLLFDNLDLPWCSPDDDDPLMQYPHTHTHSSQHRNPVAGSPPRRSQIPRGLPFIINGINTPLEQKFFMHFTTTTSRVLTNETNTQNPLLTNILPRSLQDPMIQRAILCLGASHLLSIVPSPESDLMLEKGRLLRHTEHEQIKRIETAHSISKQITKAELDAILSCTMLLCLYEICEGTGDVAWRIRLDVARDLLQNAITDHRAVNTSAEAGPISNNKSLDVNEFLLEFFIYHDILAAVTDQSRRPTLSSSLWTSTRINNQRPYMIGIEDGLFDLVSRVAALRSRDSPESIICEALVLWEELNEWQPATSDPDHKLACSAYISALFVWLYSLINPLNIADEKVREAVKTGMEAMENIQGSGVLAFLLFPTFVLGHASTTSQERQQCTAQFDRLRHFSGLGNVKLARKLVRLSWDAYDNGALDAWDWVHQMEQHGISLPVT